MPSASGAPWKPAAPDRRRQGPRPRCTPVTQARSSGVLEHLAWRAARTSHRQRVRDADAGVSGTGAQRLAPRGHPRASAACGGRRGRGRSGPSRRPVRREVVGHLLLALLQLLARPWSAAGRRRRCRGCGRSRAGGSGPAGRRRRTSTGAPSSAGAGRRVAKSGRAHSTNAPGKDRQPSSASSRLPVLALGQRQHRVADHADGAVARRRRGSRRRRPRRSTPIWQAARPTPSAAYIVATMSATSGAQLVVVRRHRLPAGGASPACPSGSSGGPCRPRAAGRAARATRRWRHGGRDPRRRRHAVARTARPARVSR